MKDVPNDFLVTRQSVRLSYCLSPSNDKANNNVRIKSNDEYTATNVTERYIWIALQFHSRGTHLTL